MGTLPLWKYWLDLAEHFAREAETLRDSDEAIDRIADAFDGIRADPQSSMPPTAMTETKATMLALASAANAIDGVYGSIKRLVQPPRSRAARERQILEALKLGFGIGHFASAWDVELRWLFQLRGRIVHNAEVSRPLKVARVTEAGTVVVGSAELFELGADSAARAASLARSILRECIARPKATTKVWAAQLQAEEWM